MKRKDIKKCAIYGKGVMHTGLPLFWRVSVERMAIDMKAVNRRHGLEMMFGGGVGGAALAEAMGLDEDLAVPLENKTTVLICEDCAMVEYPIAGLTELVAED